MSRQAPNTDAFYQLVWKIVQQVPPGEVTTYGQIASMIPCPPDWDETDWRRLSPRWVGDAMNAVSGEAEVEIPWQRVINSKGGISLSMEGKLGRLQHLRLLTEGVDFDDRLLVDLRKFGWDGPDAAFLEANQLLIPRPLAVAPAPKADTPKQLSLF